MMPTRTVSALAPWANATASAATAVVVRNRMMFLRKPHPAAAHGGARRRLIASKLSYTVLISMGKWEHPMSHALERAYDGIIIGAGHHGMVLGSYLAKAGLDILVVERRLDYGGGLSTKEVTEPGFYHNLHSINHFHISETPWFKDLGLGERVTYITPRYEFGQAHSDGTALVLGRDLEETV